MRGYLMIRLNVLKLLEEQGKTKYWLYKQMDLSYQNFSKLVNNETKSIRFDNLEKLSKLLNCSIDDLFERISIYMNPLIEEARKFIKLQAEEILKSKNIQELQEKYHKLEQILSIQSISEAPFLYEKLEFNKKSR